VKVFITGSSGYIGAHLSRALIEDGHSVMGIDRNPEADLSVDLSSENATEQLTSVFDVADEGSVVVHLAAKKSVGESVAHPDLYAKNNVGGTQNLLKAMKSAGLNKMIFASTAAVYGDLSPLVDENSATHPISPYAETKLAEEALIQSAHGDWGLRFMAARYFNVSGAGWSDLIERKGENIFPRILQAAAENKSFKIFGTDYPTADGTCVRDYIHILDLVEAHKKAINFIQEEQLGIINLGTSSGSSVRQVVNEFSKHIKFDIENAERREGDMATLLTENERAEEMLNWSATRSLEEMVSSVL